MSFWGAAVIISAFSVTAWAIVAIVENVSKTRMRKHEAQLELERDYLRRMLSEIEDIKAELAKQRENTFR